MTTEVTDLIISVFNNHYLHKLTDNLFTNDSIILRSNSKFAHYIHPIRLAEWYFEEWLYAMQTSEYESNRNAIVDGVYPIHVDRVNKDSWVELKISLYLDFWFPWTMGWNRGEPAQSAQGMYDNRQLS